MTSRSLLLEITHCPIVVACKQGDTVSGCKKIVDVQRSVPLVDHQVPEPWSGDVEQARILFVASNPSISSAEEYPTWETSAEERIEFFNRRFGGGAKEWVKDGTRSLQKDGTHSVSGTNFWKSVRSRAKELLEREVEPGIDYALTEVVRCKSKEDHGVPEALETCVENYLVRTIEASVASVIVVLGENARRGVKKSFGCPERHTLAGPIDIGGRPRMFVSLGHPSSFDPKRFETCLDSASRKRLREWVNLDRLADAASGHTADKQGDERNAASEREKDGACPHCGSKRLILELRDADFPAPPSAYGSWIVCSECRNEWPDAHARMLE